MESYKPNSYTEPHFDAEPGSHKQHIEDLATKAVVVKFKDTTVVLDVSSAVSVEDVERTIRALFGIKKGAEVLLRRSSTGAVVIPGPKLPNGHYVLEELKSGWHTSYENLRDNHYPVVKQHVLAAVGHTSQKSQESAKFIAAKTRDLVPSVQRGWGHTKQAVATSGSAVREKWKRAALVAKDHSETNSHTWTAKLFASFVRCAPAPMAFIMGVPVEELIRSTEEESTSSVTGETVPLSRPAQENPVSTPNGTEAVALASGV
eukprot:TRINITY_DN32477_c0_g1_i1.p1 TRINITY_DN32477_c0_g1~~TRINITY_DN32477_c0_g1_i1.p1  ORF type:complete len:261 (-),score=30.67 TRINITY_DN32477_c0_g1_i1:1449-2231(-)